MESRHPCGVCAALLLTLAASGCLSLDYDLSGVPVPVSAKSVDPGSAAEVEPFRIETRNTLWIHGLLGRNTPDIGALVAEQAAGWDEIAGFRVQQRSGVSHWLLAHLSLTLIRMRKVVIEGQLVRELP